MSLADLLTRTITIRRRSPGASVDAYGNRIVTTSTTTTVGELQQRPRTADAEPQDDLSDTLWLLVLPAGTGIDSGDTVTVDGQSFEVSGEPWRARHPRTGVEHHVEVNLRRVAAATG